MLLGIYKTKSIIVSQIARSIKGNSKNFKAVLNGQERLLNTLLRRGNKLYKELLEINYEFCAKSICKLSKKLKRSIIISVDLSSIEKRFSEKTEKMYYHWNGTKKQSVMGYSAVGMLAMVKNKIIPLDISVIEKRCKNFLSYNNEVLKRLFQLPNSLLKGALFVFDRGFASKSIMTPLLKSNVKFLIRLQENRLVKVGGGLMRHIKFLKQKILESNDYCYFETSSKHHKKPQRIKYVFHEVYLNEINSKLYLIAFKSTRSGLVFLITNKPVLNFWQAQEMIKTYIKRWTIESFFKFNKVCLNIEKFYLRKIQKIKFMFLFISISLSLAGVFFLNEKNFKAALKYYGFEYKKVSFYFWRILDFINFLLSNIFINKIKLKPNPI